jgi:hypothetical protein
MKITVKKEKYYNHQCPPVPKKVWDVFYQRLLFGIRNSGIFHKKSNRTFETMDIRVKQAYPNSTFHFYVSINGLPEFHMAPYSYAHPKDKFYRYDWVRDLEVCENIDMGEAGKICLKRYNERWHKIHMKKHSKSCVNALKHKWNQYQNLKKYFNE